MPSPQTYGVFYAHSIADEPIDTWERLEWHLRRAGALARRFARTFGIGTAGAAAGLLHDIGKYSDAFQRLIRESRGKVDHATPGAKVALNEYGRPLGLFLSYGIAGHHAGLPDGGGAEDRDLDARLKKPLEPGYERWRDQGNRSIRLPSRQAIDDEVRSFLRGADLVNDAFPAAFLIRMLFSCLVDADFLATEWFLDRSKSRARRRLPKAGALAPILARYIEQRFGAAEPADRIARQRADILTACRGAASSEPGVFTLTVPTGGGKTLSSLAFALEHAAANGLDRVIYAIPYTSIIEQTADVFRAALREAGDVVVEHHSAADVPRTGTGEEPVGPMRLHLATENWDAPIVVTTTVQLFESLYANGPSRCRKLHNLARSVIVLDEAQALPIEHLAPCLAALKELTTRYHATVVLCSATLPALDQAPTLVVQLPPAKPIVTTTAELRQAFARVKAHRADVLEDAEVVENLVARKQALCIVDARKHAIELFDLLPDDGSRFHLSAGMCPAHRRQVLGAVNDRLRDGLPCRLIATRVIEAGIDIDFPVVWRALAGVDSLAQAAGRCNRNGRLESGEFVVFRPAREDAIPRPLSDLRRRRSIAEAVLRDHDDPLSSEAVDEFFHRLLKLQATEQDRDGCLARLSPTGKIDRLPFRSVAEDFRMIDDDAQSVIVPFDDHARQLISRLGSLIARPGVVRRLPTDLLRNLQSYAVNTYDLDKLVARGSALRIDPESRFHVLALGPVYDKSTGIRPERAGLFDSNANLF